MKEITVISGKGGTGKTSLVSCFAALSRDKVMADCDVDAADLHLILKPCATESTPFIGGKRAAIVPERCTACGDCAELCRFGAIHPVGTAAASGAGVIGDYRIDPAACEGCGVCAWFCPERAIDFGLVRNGTLYVSETDLGPLVHARLGVAEENSGKLVSTVRARARELARERDCELVIVDGAPGVGCPVIASITNTDLVVVVTEPTLSGRHDLLRVLELLRHFGILGAVLVNKSDLSPELSDGIGAACAERGVPVIGRIPYTRDFVRAMIAGRPYVDHAPGPIADGIRLAWTRIRAMAGLAGGDRNDNAQRKATRSRT